VAAEAAQLPRGHCRYILAIKDDGTLGRLDEAQEQASERRLSRARLADHPEDLAALNFERDLRDGTQRLLGRSE